jgi:hypothetical protein
MTDRANDSTLPTRSSSASALATEKYPGLRIIERAGPRAVKRFLEYFVVNIPNPNTRAAYACACGQFLN